MTLEDGMAYAIAWWELHGLGCAPEPGEHEDEMGPANGAEGGES